MRTLPVMVDEADDLYGLPDDEFTSARDALAKRLRGEKRREEADAVKALRRPSVAAAAINRAVREHGADDLLAAGEALREAHEALLSGNGDATAVREATTSEREAVRDFARLALGEGASRARRTRSAPRSTPPRSTTTSASCWSPGRLEREAEAGADPMAMLASGKARSSRPSRPRAQLPEVRAALRRHEAGAPAARSRTAPAAPSGRSPPRPSSGGRRRPSGRRRRPIAR